MGSDDAKETMSTRDSDGYVLCCHGRPIQCLECGEEYAIELDRPIAKPTREWLENRLRFYEQHTDKQANELVEVTIQRDKWLAAFNRSEQFQDGPTKQRDDALRALGNCYVTARRELRRLKNTGRVELIHGLDSTSVERWQHIVRFCEEAGCRLNFLRAALPTELTDGEDTNESDYCDDCRTYHTGACPTARIPRPQALAWVEKQPGQDAPSIHILNLLDIISGLTIGLTIQCEKRPTERELYADGFQNAIHKVAYDFVRYYVDGTDGCRNCGGFPHASTCFVWKFASAITADYLSRSAPVIKEMFTAGWNAGFREAQEPDRYPDRDRCEDAFQEWIKERNDAAEQKA